MTTFSTVAELLLAFEAGLEPPAAPDWNAFQVWRRTTSTRPRSSTTTSEVKLWRELNLELYGMPQSVADDAASALQPSGGRHSETRPDVAELKAKLLEVFDPDSDDVDSYKERLSGLVAALEEAGEYSQQDSVEVYLRVQTAGLSAVDQLKYLKELFGETIISEPESESDVSIRNDRLVALSEWLRARGVTVSSRVGKLFSPASTPSLTPERLQQQQRELAAAAAALNARKVVTPAASAVGRGDGGNSAANKRIWDETFEYSTPRQKPGIQTYQEDDKDGKSSSSSPNQELADAIREQTQAMLKMLANKSDNQRLHSTIKVSPTVQWPKLGDDGPDAKEVEEFFEKFDEVCGLANDGQGMSDKERLKVLWSCLKGSREKTYRVLHKKHKKLGDVDKDPAMVFKVIKTRLMRFVETALEKQMRVLNEFECLQKGKLTALQFEPQWEEALAELESVGLGRNERELMLNYLTKVGSALASDIQKDLRAWPDGSGGMVSRRVATWEECHQIALELESLKCNTKSLQQSFNYENNQNRSGKGNGKGDRPSGMHSEGQARICYEFRDNGTCKHGKDCRFSHDAAAIAKAKKEKDGKSNAQKQEPAVQPDAAVNAQKGKGKGKKADAKAKAKAKPVAAQTQEQKDRLCGYIKRGENCPYGKECKFSHNKKRFDQDGKLKQTASQSKPAEAASGAASDGWGQPVGMQRATGCIRLIADAESSPVVMHQVAIQTAVPQSASVQPNGLKSLSELPASWWVSAASDHGGYQYQTDGIVLGAKLRILLDGCAGVNSIAEETVVSMINKAKQMNVRPDSAEFPIVQLEKWDKREQVTGVKRDAAIQVIGAVVLRVGLLQVSGKTGPSILVRAKVFERGASEFQGLILGGRALDCEAHGGLGFRPVAHGHVLETLGIVMPRAEQVDPRPDKAYAFQLTTVSAFDSDEEQTTQADPTESAEFAASSASCGSPSPSGMPAGDFLLFDGDPVVLEPGEGALVPVLRCCSNLPSGVKPAQEAVLQICDDLDVVPGLWETGSGAGVVFIANVHQLDLELDRGKVVALVSPVVAQTRVCTVCRHVDSEAWQLEGSEPTCECGAVLPGGASACRNCGGHTAVFSYSGCSSCGFKCAETPTTVGSVYHIVEEPGAIDRIVDVLCPPETYYEQLRADMAVRHPDADRHVLDHLVSLEAFLDRSIVSGFSYGVDKAQLLVTKGNLLGHVVSRTGLEADGSRVEAIWKFPPLKEKLHIQQFLGSTNWLRQYLDKAYSTCVKRLGEYMKPGAVFPPGGLGEGEDEGSKAVRAIKVMCRDRMQLEVLDEAAAIDGSRPLEQIADCSGYGYGGTGLQMRADLAGFKVLFTAGKGLTPAQQAWPPLTLEAYAQLETKRAQRACLGPMRSICWTDHANLTKQQSSEHIDVKHLRWVAEITSDGSCIRSLSGRAAKLGDGISRNPSNRDEILQQRSKDLAGLCGQLRGFDLDEFLSDHEDPSIALPWTLASDAVPDKPMIPKVQTIAAIAAEEGLAATVKVLYVADYVPTSVRQSLSAKLWRDLSVQMPKYKVIFSVSEGPFEDDDGAAFAHFDSSNKGKLNPAKLVLETKRDLLTSVVKLLRSCAMQRPKVIVADGQGALVALAVSRPLLVECALAARNVQHEEVTRLAEAWGEILAIVIRQPRIGKSKANVELFRLAAPEVFEVFPEKNIAVLAVHGRTDALFDELNSLYKLLPDVMLASGVSEVMWQQLIEEKRAREMWSHAGKCSCGRRSFLFGMCSNCVKDEAKERHAAATDKAEEELAEAKEEIVFQSVDAVKLFEPVGRPPVQLTGITKRVSFITDELVKLAGRKDPKEVAGSYEVSVWKRGATLKLPTSDKPFRLVCCYEPETGGVKVVQQCVAVRFELSHVVSASAWEKSLDECPLARDWSSVRGALDEFWYKKPSLRVSESVIVPPKLFDELKAAFRQVLNVDKVRLTRGSLPPRVAKPEHGFCIVRSDKEGWEFKPVTKAFWLSRDEWAWIVEGRSSEESIRKVVSFFDSNWMCFDPDGKLASAAREFKARTAAIKKEEKVDVKFEVEVKTEPDDDTDERDLQRHQVQRWWTEAEKQRESAAEEAKAEAGVVDIEIGDSIRTSWMMSQRTDQQLAPLLKRKWNSGDSYRVALDGLLEVLVKQKNRPDKWVPVVPDGQANAVSTWKQWIFLQVHIGIYGAHRNENQTIVLLLGICSWTDLRKDVKAWVDRCLTCIRFRKRPTKQEAIAVRPTHLEAWEEVMIDFEGPSNPPDASGNRYVLSYLCLLCHGVLLEPVAQLTFSEVRRAFARCIFRSGTLPVLIRSDRGPEFRNAMMKEFTALIGARQRFGLPWRPIEQAPVERVHQEVQKCLGILFCDVVKCYPEEWTELLPVLEFVLYNTPNGHGLTPRDVDRRWSLAIPLAKELTPFQVLEFEPVSDYAKELFKSWREVRGIVLKHFSESSATRAALANRFRRSRTLEAGMRVVYRDPRSKGAGGRLPWKAPLNGPAVLVSVQGNRVQVRRSDGTVVELHVEDIVIVPSDAVDMELESRPAAELDTASATAERSGNKRSVGEMLESKEKDKDKAITPNIKPGKIDKLSVGTFVAYSQGGASKKLRIGKVSGITRDDGTVIVVRYRPLSDGRLRVKWIPAEGTDAYGKTFVEQETVAVRQIVTAVQLHEGILAHSVARRLDKSGWKLDDADATVEPVLPEPSVAWNARLEQFVLVTRELPGLSDEPSGAASSLSIKFDSHGARQEWLGIGQVHFLEIYCGFQELTLRVRESGLTAGEGLDSKLISYGQVWPLHVLEVRQQAARLIVDVLKPRCVHTGTPCTHLCTIGAKDHGQHDESPQLVEFSLAVAAHQHARGLLASNETPGGSQLLELDVWTAVFGTPTWPKQGWRVTKSDGCQCGVVYPGVDDPGRPMQKCKQWSSNFDLSGLNLRCRRPTALAGATHEHRQIRGGCKLPDGHWASVATLSGRYTAEESTLYARSLCLAMKDIKPRSDGGQTALEQLARSGGALESTPKELKVEHKVGAVQPWTCKVFTIGSGEAAAGMIHESDSDRQVRLKRHSAESAAAKLRWDELARAKNWDSVRADLAVYKHSGMEVKKDPRLAESYKDTVLEGVGFGSAAVRPGLSEADLRAAREVLRRKAAAFWIEGAPRTTIVGVQHDTVPTGPPCKTPPHALRGESAEWVDLQLQKEVERGQLERGNSPWGSPPFPTKEFPEHRKQRKRRMVIDYRRVNARTLRAVYYLRKSSEVLSAAAGSLFLSLLDAVTGFNLVVNTDRARQMLAIVARCGQFLPRCLTFGPVNGPEDFGFTVDRIFGATNSSNSPSSSLGRFCKEWLAYVDDLTVRTGRFIDGQSFSDQEAGELVRKAVSKSRVDLGFQPAQESFQALGFDTTGLGKESVDKENRVNAVGLGRQYSSDPSPYAHPKSSSYKSSGSGDKARTRSPPRGNRSASAAQETERGRSPRRGQWRGDKERDRKASKDVSIDRIYAVSRALTNVVRHGKAGLATRTDGFFIAAVVCDAINAGKAGWVVPEPSVTVGDIFQVVDEQRKPRFELAKLDVEVEAGSSDTKGTILCVRALQGHSIPVVESEIYTPYVFEPGTLLYHGTQIEHVNAIWSEGLRTQQDLLSKAGGRKHVMMGRVYNVRDTAGVRTGSTAVITVDPSKVTAELWLSAGGAVVCKERIEPEALVDAFKIDPKSLTKISTLKWRINLAPTPAPVPASSVGSAARRSEESVAVAAAAVQPVLGELPKPRLPLVAKRHAGSDRPLRERSPTRSPSREMRRRARSWQTIESDSDMSDEEGLVDLVYPETDQPVEAPAGFEFEIKDGQAKLLRKQQRRLEVQLRHETLEVEAKEEGWTCVCSGVNLPWRKICYCCSSHRPSDFAQPEEDNYSEAGEAKKKRKRGGKKHRKRLRRIGLGRRFSSCPSPYAHPGEFQLALAGPAVASFSSLSVAALYLGYVAFVQVDEVINEVITVVSETALDITKAAKATGRVLRRVVVKFIQLVTRVTYFIVFVELLLVAKQFTYYRSLGRRFVADPSPFAQAAKIDTEFLSCGESFQGLRENPAVEDGRLQRGGDLQKSVTVSPCGKMLIVSTYKIKTRQHGSGLSCECKDHLFGQARGGLCKHVIAAKLWLHSESSKTEPVPAALPPPVQQPLQVRFEQAEVVEVPVSRAVSRGIAASGPDSAQSSCFEGLRAKFLQARQVQPVQTVYTTRPSTAAADLEEAARAERIRAPSPEIAVAVGSSAAKKVVQKSNAASSSERGATVQRSSSVQRSAAASSSGLENRATPRASAVPIVSEAPQGGELGSLRGILSGIEAQQTAVELLRKARFRGLVIFTGYTLDREEIVDELCAAFERGASVRVVLDRGATLEGRTRNQLSSALRLSSTGIEVRLTEGKQCLGEYSAVGRRVPSHIKGIMHAKSLLVASSEARDSCEVLIGSCNWTTSSRSNFELVSHVRVDRAELVKVVAELMLVPWEAGTEVKTAQISDAQRARSVSPSRYQR